MLNCSLDHIHNGLRATLKMPTGFVLHSLRHTNGKRLGEGGADAFSIMRLIGHSSVTISSGMSTQHRKLWKEPLNGWKC